MGLGEGLLLGFQNRRFFDRGFLQPGQLLGLLPQRGQGRSYLVLNSGGCPIGPVPGCGVDRFPVFNLLTEFCQRYRKLGRLQEGLSICKNGSGQFLLVEALGFLGLKLKLILLFL